MTDFIGYSASPFASHGEQAAGNEPAAELPVSINQEKRLLLEELARGRSLQHPPFSIPLILHLSGPADPVLLQNCLDIITRRHPILRTAFLPSKRISSEERQARLSLFAVSGVFFPGLYYRLRKDNPVPLKVRSLNAADAAERNTEIRKIAEELLCLPFDYAQPPFVRAVLLTTPKPEESILVLSIHHLVADRGSLEIMQQELEKLYGFCAGQHPYPAEPAATYFDFIALQDKKLRAPEFDKALSYWKQQWPALNAAQIHYRNLPFALPKPEISSFAQSVETIVLDKSICDRLRTFARQCRTTPYVLFLAGFALLLHGITRKSSVAVWGCFENRSPEMGDTIGWFANSHLMGVNCGDDPILTEFLKKMRKFVFEMLDHQDLPLAALWPKLQCQEDAGDLMILFDVVIEGNQHTRAATSGSLTFRKISDPQIFMKSHVGLAVCVMESGTETRLEATYFKDRFTAGGIHKFLQDFQHVLDLFPMNAAQHISELVRFAKDRKFTVPQPDDGPQEKILAAHADWQLIHQTDWGS